MNSLNKVYSSLSARRRYEVWFIRMGLADGCGAWWFRYLLTNPGRNGCVGYPVGMPVQLWATWFPRAGTPRSVIQGFKLEGLELHRPPHPFQFRIHDHWIDENSCRGVIQQNGCRVGWDLNYRSQFATTLSDKGWIGFSRTPHSDAMFSGEITVDGQRFSGEPVGFGLQGHNCGYRHRTVWRWAHAFLPQPNGKPSTLEALAYDMPLGLVFRKAILWHAGQAYVFRNFKEQIDSAFGWNIRAASRNLRINASFEGFSTSLHHLPYLKTDCSGTFDVRNNSLANAIIQIEKPGSTKEKLETIGGAVLEMSGA